MFLCQHARTDERPDEEKTRAPENEDEKTGGTNRAATGSQLRPDVQEGRPPTAPTRAADAQARGQRAEHQPARPSAVIAKPDVQAGAESGGGKAGRMTAQRAGGRPAGWSGWRGKPLNYSPSCRY